MSKEYDKYLKEVLGVGEGFVGITRHCESKSKWSDIARNVSRDSAGYLSVGDCITDRLKDGREFTVEVAAINPYETNTVVLVFKNAIGDHCMNTVAANNGSWRDSEMRRWLNEEFIELLPDELRMAIKPRLISQRQDERILESEDKLWIPSEVEIFGESVCSHSNEDDTQFELFKDIKNRMKTYADGSPAYWWERSPDYYGSNIFCSVHTSGSAYSSYADYYNGVAPAFII